MPIPSQTKTERIRRYLALSWSLSQEKPSRQTITALNQALKLVRFPFKQTFPAGVWPERTYIINHDYKYIYCPITKVASSYFKNLILHTSNLQDSPKLKKYKTVHEFALAHLSLSQYSSSVARQYLQDKNYFTFAFVRNPGQRLISAYLDKFIRTRPDRLAGFTVRVIREVYRHRGAQPDLVQSISFREFVNYVARNNDSNLNEHWRSQHVHLGAIDFDFIGQLENVADFDYIQQKFNLSAPELKQRKKKDNKSSTRANLTYGEPLIDCYPPQLKNLSSFPYFHTGDFLTPEILSLIRQRYYLDFHLLGY